MLNNLVDTTESTPPSPKHIDSWPLSVTLLTERAFAEGLGWDGAKGRAEPTRGQSLLEERRGGLLLLSAIWRQREQVVGTSQEPNHAQPC